MTTLPQPGGSLTRSKNSSVMPQVNSQAHAASSSSRRRCRSRSPADAQRLRDGLATLDQQDPERAARVRQRAADSWIRLAPGFPGDPVSGALTLDGSGEPTAAFDGFADDEPCPALDPAFGTCDLYDARPYTCRAFGPPIAVAEGYGACELCFQHATAEEVAAAAIEEPPAGTAQALDRAAIEAGEPSAPTIIAFVLSRP